MRGEEAARLGARDEGGLRLCLSMHGSSRKRKREGRTQVVPLRASSSPLTQAHARCQYSKLTSPLTPVHSAGRKYRFESLDGTGSAHEER